jgi:hypothetical protein
MATRLYSIDPGNSDNQVVSAVGSAIVTKNIELTINTSPTLIPDTNTATGTRAITREEVLEALLKFENFILTNNWPPQAT